MGEVVEMRPCGDVGLFARNQTVSNLLFLGEIENGDFGAEAYFVTRDSRHIDHGEFAQTGTKLAKTHVDNALAFLGGVVLGVLAQIAMRARFGDLAGKVDAQFDVEGRYFLFKLLL